MNQMNVERRPKRSAVVHLKNKKTLFTGGDGSGKTYTFKDQVKKQGLRFFCWVYDYSDFEKESVNNFLIFNHTKMKSPLKEMSKEQQLKEFDAFIRLGIQLKEKGDIDGIFIDEFDYLLDGNEKYPESFLYLITQNRHAGGKGLAVVGASKRANSTNTKFAESVQQHVIFGMSGENINKKYNGYIRGLGDLITGNLRKGVQPLKYEQNNPKNEFIIFEVGHLPVVYE